MPNPLLTSLLLSMMLAAAGARADSLEEARARVKSGEIHYALGEFSAAAADFKEAYRMKSEPALLFNIAQSMRQMGHYREAHFYYAQYLHQKPEAANRADVEAFMAALRQKIEADAAPAKPLVRPLPAPAEVPSPPVGQAPPALGSGAPIRVEPPKSAASDAPASAASADPVTAAAPSVRTPSTEPLPEPRATSAEQPPLAAQVPPAHPVAPQLTLTPDRLGSAAPRTASEGSSRTALRAAGIAGLGLGLVSGVAAVVFKRSANASARSISAAYQSGQLSPAQAGLKKSMDSDGRKATGFAIGGAVLAAVGATLTWTF